MSSVMLPLRYRLATGAKERLYREVTVLRFNK